MDTTPPKLFRLSKPDYLEEAHRKRKGFPFLVELIKFWILFKGTMWLVPLLVGKLLGPVLAALSPLGMMALQSILLGCMGLLFILYMRLIDRRGPRSMGFVDAKNLPREALLGAALGFAMFALCVLAALALGGAKFESFHPEALGLALLMLPCTLFQSAGEEMMYRGYFLTNSTVKCPLWPAVVLNGLLFAAGHLSNAGGMAFFPVLNGTLVGILFAVLALRRGSIWAACTVHGLWNYTQGFIFGLPISGGETGGGTLLQFSLAEGRPLVTGGAYGLEGSLITTVVEALAIVLVLLLTQKGSRAAAADDPNRATAW